MKLWLKSKKNLGFYKTLLAELRLEDEYNYKNHLRMASEKQYNNITKENTKMMGPILRRL